MANAPHLMKFLETARHFVGLKESGNNSFTDPRGRELWNLWGYNASGTAWCAIFVSACAQKAGIAGKVMSFMEASPFCGVYVYNIYYTTTSPKMSSVFAKNNAD